MSENALSALGKPNYLNGNYLPNSAKIKFSNTYAVERRIFQDIEISYRVMNISTSESPQNFLHVEVMYRVAQVRGRMPGQIFLEEGRYGPKGYLRFGRPISFSEGRRPKSGVDLINGRSADGLMDIFIDGERFTTMHGVRILEVLD